jgi:hypothetical protein
VIQPQEVKSQKISCPPAFVSTSSLKIAVRPKMMSEIPAIAIMIPANIAQPSAAPARASVCA